MYVYSTTKACKCVGLVLLYAVRSEARCIALYVETTGCVCEEQ